MLSNVLLFLVCVCVCYTQVAYVHVFGSLIEQYNALYSHYQQYYTEEEKNKIMCLLYIERGY